MTNTATATIIWAAGPDRGAEVPADAQIAVTVWEDLDHILEVRHADGEWYEVKEA